MRVLARPAAWPFLPALAGLLAVGPPAAAHPGGPDVSGWHTGRKTGELPLPPRGRRFGRERVELRP